MSSALRVLSLVASLAVGCGSHKLPDPSPAPVGNTGGTTAPSPAPGAAREAVVHARIVNSGPIGDGNCSQRSYEIAVDKVVSGELTEPQLWVHFEACGDARGAIAFDGTGLDTGKTYRLTLRRGASASFGDDYVIVDAE